MKSNKLTEEQRNLLREAIRFNIPDSYTNAPQDVLDALDGYTPEEAKAWACGIAFMAEKTINAIDSVTCFRHYDVLKTTLDT